MITCRHYRDGVLKEHGFDPARVSDILEDPSARIWLDLEDPSEQELALIEEEFGLHPVAMEDLRHRDQRPKVEVFEGHFFVVAHGVKVIDGEVVISEVHAFTSTQFLITLRYPPSFDLTPVLRRWDQQPELTEEGAGFLLYALLDEVVDEYFSVIDKLDQRSEDIEDQVFADEIDQSLQQQIFHLKRKVVVFRRSILPLREVLDLLQEQPALVTSALMPYYRDVADHVARAIELIDHIREILTAALEAQISQLSYQLNQTMKRLTSWAAIILLPTLIAGVYGMNFDHMPELDWLFGYPFALGLMAVGAFSLYKMFRRRDWL